MDRADIVISGSTATVEGRVAGSGTIVAQRDQYLAIHFPGRKVFSGQGRPFRWVGAHYEFWLILERQSDSSVYARRLFSFQHDAHRDIERASKRHDGIQGRR